MTFCSVISSLQVGPTWKMKKSMKSELKMAWSSKSDQPFSDSSTPVFDTGSTQRVLLIQNDPQH